MPTPSPFVVRVLLWRARARFVVAAAVVVFAAAFDGSAGVGHAAAAANDAAAPSTPAGLVVGGQTSAGFWVSWATSTDNQGVAGYGVYLNGARVGGTGATELRYPFSGLACATGYTVGVDAVDAAGNRSAVASVWAATAACAGLSVPLSVPSGLGVSGQTASGFRVSWSASSGAAGYRVYLNGSRIGSTGAVELSYPFAGQACGSSFTVGVDAVDAAGDSSAVASVSASTLACSGPSGPGDTQAPSVSLTSPAAGATVTGTVSVAAAASDNVGVSSVQLLVDGAVLGSDSASPYTWGWNTTSLPDGTHTLAGARLRRCRQSRRQRHGHGLGLERRAGRRVGRLRP